FNGLNLLDGTFTTKEIQVGAFSGTSQRISIDITSTLAKDLGAAYTVGDGTTAVGSTAAASGDITITVNGKTHAVGASTADGVSTTGATSSALSFANAINAITAKTGVTATSVTTKVGAAQDSTTGGGALGANDLKINGVDIGAVTLSSDTGT